MPFNKPRRMLRRFVRAADVQEAVQSCAEHGHASASDATLRSWGRPGWRRLRLGPLAARGKTEIHLTSSNRAMAARESIEKFKSYSANSETFILCVF